MSLEKIAVGKPFNTTRVRRIQPLPAFEKLEDRQLMSMVLPGPIAPLGMNTDAPTASFALQQTPETPSTTTTNNIVNTDSSSGPSTITTPPVQGQTSPLSVSFNSIGLSAITYNGVKLLDLSMNPFDGFRVGTYTVLNADGTRTQMKGGDSRSQTFNAGTQTVTITYDWGSIACKYTVLADRVGMAITVTNNSADTITGVNLNVVALRFPVSPTFSGDGWGMAFGTIGPSATAADFTSGTAAFVSDDALAPIYSGFLAAGQLTTTANRYEVRFGTTPESGMPVSWPAFDNMIAPGTTATYNTSLRFAAGHTALPAIASDAIQKFTAVNPMTLNWTDRRPIGELFPTGSTPEARTAANPNGWFNDSRVDVTTPQGLAAFRTRLLAYADQSVSILKQMNSQGMVTWDLEGEQYGRATYIGDPRLATQLAPELAYQNVVDAYFKKFTDAGLRVGLTIRPTEVQFDKDGPYQADSPNVAQTLIDKINYAKTRWGCTLFYIDSVNWTMNADVFKQVMTACPGVLLMPELQNTQDYAYTAPYDEVRQGVTSTPTAVRQVYPNAFSVIETSTALNLADFQTQLNAAVANGDILMFSAWFNAPGNAMVKTSYDAAARSAAPAAAPVAPAPVITPATSPSGAQSSFSNQVITATNQMSLSTPDSATDWLKAA